MARSDDVASETGRRGALEDDDEEGNGGERVRPNRLPRSARVSCCDAEIMARSLRPTAVLLRRALSSARLASLNRAGSACCATSTLVLLFLSAPVLLPSVLVLGDARSAGRPGGAEDGGAVAEVPRRMKGRTLVG